MWLSTDPLSGYNPVMETEHYIDGQHNGGVFNSFNLNTYGYCYQNPVLYVDPNGKQSIGERLKGWGEGLGSFARDSWDGFKDQMRSIYIINFGSTSEIQALATNSFNQAEQGSKYITSGQAKSDLSASIKTPEGQGYAAGMLASIVIQRKIDVRRGLAMAFFMKSGIKDIERAVQSMLYIEAVFTKTYPKGTKFYRWSRVGQTEKHFFSPEKGFSPTEAGLESAMRTDPSTWIFEEFTLQKSTKVLQGTVDLDGKKGIKQVFSVDIQKNSSVKTTKPEF